jgi:SAM-dependent methyltransferase
MGMAQPLDGMVEIRHAADGRQSRAGYERIFGGAGIRQPRRTWPRVLDLLEARPGERLLDLASGEAGVLEAARGRGLEAVALDLSILALRRARDRAPGAVVLAGDGERLPFADGAFERVLCFGSLEHFDDPAAGAREVARVLAPAGRALVQLPNTFGLRWNVAHAWRHGEPCDDGQPIQRYGTRHQWRRLLETAGLRVLRTCPYEDRTHLQRPWHWLAAARHPSRWLIPLAPWLPVDMAMAFMFVCAGTGTPAPPPGPAAATARAAR